MIDKVLKKNFIYLFILQNVNYIIPLLILPYLTRVLGVENYGRIAFTQAFISYFILITDFGFNTSATQSIAQKQKQESEISKIFWSTLTAKLLFSIISISILTILIVLSPKLQKESDLLYTAFLSVIASAIFPVWLFQGIEKMSLITILSVIPKVISLLLIFLFVKHQENVLLALQIQVGSTLATAMISLYVIKRMHIVKYTNITFKDVKLQILDSWHIFIAGVATNIYTTTNIVVLGLLTNNTTVGIYSAADKIIRAIISLSSSITQVTFPRVNVYLNESKQKAIYFVKKLLIGVSVANILGGLIILIMAPYIVKLLFGLPEYRDVILLLRISSLLPFFAITNGIIAINIFITFGLKNYLVKIVGLGGVFSLIFVFPFAFLFKAEGVAICALLTEIIITFMLLRKLRKINFN